MRLFAISGVIVQKPLGVLALLDEELNFTKATDLTFANKLKQHFKSQPHFKGERGRAFGVRHYAGEVSCFYLLWPFSFLRQFVNYCAHILSSLFPSVGCIRYKWVFGEEQRSAAFRCHPTLFIMYLQATAITCLKND